APGPSQWWWTSDFLTAGAGDPHLPAVVAALVANPGGLLRLRVDHLHVADVDQPFCVHDAAFLGTTPALLVDLLFLLDHVDAMDQHPLLVRVNEDDLAYPATVLARDDEYVV